MIEYIHFPYKYELMKSIFTTLLFSMLVSFSIAQPFAIGYTNANFEDASRADRPVPTEIHYPTTVAGQDVAVQGTNLPVVVVGHGFVMGIGAYLNIVNELVPNGYIVALVDTETGLPDHEAFGQDLEFAIAEIQALGVNPSIFQGKIGPNAALMGHSMGGGASFLAAPTANITCMATMAPAETTPSAIAAAANITVPSLIFAAEDDCVASIADHQQPMYDALGTDCKTMVEVLGGSHCKFAESNLACTTGELLCMGSVAREDQHTIMFDFLHPFFDAHLKGNSASLTVFNDLLASDTRTDYQQSCSSVGTEQIEHPIMKSLYPNPTNDHLFISLTENNKATYLKIIDTNGKVLLQKNSLPFTSNLELNVSNLPKGIFFLELGNKGGVETSKFIKN